MRKLLAILSILFALAACSIDREIKEMTPIEERAFADFQRLPEKSKVSLVSDDEPGETLYICGTLVDDEDTVIIPKAEILFYHTGVDGEYDESIPGEESTARINGRLVTNDVGRFFVKTILPGNYPRRTDNRHIHTLVRGARPEAYDIHFRQYTDFLASEFIRGSDQHFNVYLKRAASGDLVIFVKMVVNYYDD